MNKKEGTILIVDDEEDIRFSLQLLLNQHYSTVITESNPYHIPRLLRSRNPDLVLLDMNFSKGKTSGEEGMHWLKKIKELSPHAQVLMITAYSEVDIAVQALKSGATDFIEKPWRNQKLLATVNSAFELKSSLNELKSVKGQNEILSKALDEPFSDIIGHSSQMKVIFRTIEKVADTDAHVLITGENGTGKELIARAIHRKSKRRNRIFVPVDLGAIPENLFESELFGHKRGAFTDAIEDRTGRFETANGGTIFLDEIGNLSLPLQSKMLQVLESKMFSPVGSTQWVRVDARVICATNMPLYHMVDDKEFRQDLLYRINTVEIHIPPLRERKGDIPVLSEHFLEQLKKKYQKPGLKLHEDTFEKLEYYTWPGNVRELRHLMERAVILSEQDEIKPHDFIFPHAQKMKDQDSLNLEELEKNSIVKALDLHRGNISKAAGDLGITRAALYRRLEKYGIEVE